MSQKQGNCTSPSITNRFLHKVSLSLFLEATHQLIEPTHNNTLRFNQAHGNALRALSPQTAPKTNANNGNPTVDVALDRVRELSSTKDTVCLTLRPYAVEKILSDLEGDGVISLGRVGSHAQSDIVKSYGNCSKPQNTQKLPISCKYIFPSCSKYHHFDFSHYPD